MIVPPARCKIYNDFPLMYPQRAMGGTEALHGDGRD
jgi:hypothetical protein